MNHPGTEAEQMEGYIYVLSQGRWERAWRLVYMVCGSVVLQLQVRTRHER